MDVNSFLVCYSLKTCCISRQKHIEQTLEKVVLWDGSYE